MPERMLGGDCTAVDVWFGGGSTADVIDTGWQAPPQSLAGLPDVAGYGAVRSLRQVMTLDVGLDCGGGKGCRFTTCKAGNSFTCAVRRSAWNSALRASTRWRMACTNDFRGLTFENLMMYSNQSAT